MDSWQCPACTFLNDRGKLKCQMCDTPCGTSSRKSIAPYVAREQEQLLQFSVFSTKKKHSAKRTSATKSNISTTPTTANSKINNLELPPEPIRKKLIYSSSRRKSSTPQKRLFTKDGQVAKQRHPKPGTVALREIQFHQNTTNLLIHEMSFLRLVKQILEKNYPFRSLYRWRTIAIMALQEVAEAVLINLFQLTSIVAHNSKRCTIMLRDMQEVRRIHHHHP